MPSINEFVNYCQAANVDHIEVKINYDDINDFKENGQWVSKAKAKQILQGKETISMEVFEHYQNAFMETSIAFFVPDGTPSGGGTINLIIKGKSLDTILSEMTTGEAAEYLESLQENGVTLEPDENDVVTIPISNDLFIQNAIQYTERGGGADFSYKTKTLDLPLIGGIRVFNQEVKDEVVAKGMLCINAIGLDSIDEETSDSTEQNRKFEDTSVFGVLEKKVKNLMEENGCLEELAYILKENLQLIYQSLKIQLI